MAFLRCENGKFQLRMFQVHGPSCLLGRKPDCHIWELFENRTSVSRHHARIDQNGEQYLLTDLGSRNGTRVNGAAIAHPTPLSHGDVISICGFEFRFVQDEASDSRSTPPVEVINDIGSGVEKPVSSSADARISRLRANEVIPAATARLSALLGLLTAIGDSLEMRDVLQSLVDELLAIFPSADAALIGLQQQEGSPLVSAAMSRRRCDNDAVSLSESLVTRILSAKEALLFSDVPHEPTLTGSASIALQGIRSVMCAPLMDGKHQVVGVVHVDTRGYGPPFKELDLQVLVALAPLLTVAVRFAQFHHRALRQIAYEQELAAAHRVQRSLLPQHSPNVPGYEFFSFYSAAREVGGDYYDYIPLPDGRLALVVADAAGKGAGAALQVAAVAGGLRSVLTFSGQLVEAVCHLNRQLCRDRTEIQFVTLAIMALDPDRHEVEVLCAGHEAPLLRLRTGALTPIAHECGGLPLGVKADAAYATTRVSLAPGDGMLMYTDGVSDAQNSRREFFAEHRIRELFGGEGARIEDLGRRIVQEVFDFMGRQPQFDDISLVGLGRRNEDAARTHA